MALTAKERAQRELDKATENVEKAADRFDKAAARAVSASAALEVAKGEHATLVAIADHLSAHPALTQPDLTVEAAA